MDRSRPMCVSTRDGSPPSAAEEQDGSPLKIGYFVRTFKVQSMIRTTIAFALPAVLFFCSPFSALSQELNVPEVTITPKPWKAVWVTHPDISGNEYAAILFRKVLQLDAAPEKFVISVSADNKYVLFVNGQRVAAGPQLSDIRHWRYETVDIAPFLKKGRNVIVAEVVNYGPDRFFGMQSYRTAFIVNGNYASPSGIDPSVINTNRDGGWQTLWNKGLFGKEVRWRSAVKDIIGGFYANNPTDSVAGSAYPWGWEAPEFEGGDWKNAVFCENASAFGGGFGWILEPRNTPLQVRTKERLANVITVDGVDNADGVLKGNEPVTIPPRTSATILIDNKVLTTGYPELLFSGGKDAMIRIGYAENLFLPDGSKGNRNEWKGMKFVGIKDVVIPDGGSGRTFRPTWLRTFRFVQLEITTRDVPLVLQDFYNMYTTTPIPLKAKFRASDPMYGKIFDLCRRTVALCTQDYFLSDAYYETMQYVGDTKVHAQVWQAFTGNDLHTRNALEQFHYSRLWDGNLTSCYPLRSTFVHPTYSVIWVDMLYDYLLYSGDSTFIRKFLPGIRQTLSMFDELIAENGLAGHTRWDYFVDWYQHSNRGGLAPGQDGSNSAVVTLHYVFALQNAARIFDYLGHAAEADAYRQRAVTISGKVRAACYDAAKKLFTERPDKSYFDQHTNIMAVLTDAVPAGEQRGILERILSDTTLGQATYYYRFYLFEALRKADAADLFDRAQEPWEQLIEDGLTTALERMESEIKPTRSECHPWSTGPAYAYFTLLAGITPGDIGFSTVHVEPDLGALAFIEGSYPHPKGEIVFRFEKKGKKLRGELELPQGLSGTCEINGKTIALKEGKQNVE